MESNYLAENDLEEGVNSYVIRDNYNLRKNLILSLKNRYQSTTKKRE